MVKKIRSKTVTKEAIQWDGTWEQAQEIQDFAGDSYFERQDLDFKRTYMWLKTLEGEHMVSPGDWVIKGLKGEFYPCKPDVFTDSYEIIADI